MSALTARWSCCSTNPPISRTRVRTRSMSSLNRLEVCWPRSADSMKSNPGRPRRHHIIISMLGFFRGHAAFGRGGMPDVGAAHEEHDVLRHVLRVVADPLEALEREHGVEDRP